MKRFIIFAGTLCLLLLVISVRAAKTKEQSIYSGDAVYYKNRLVIVTGNSGRLEFFTLGGDRVEKIFSVTLSGLPEKEMKFNDVKLDIQGDELKAYAVAGYTLYRYDVSDLFSADLEAKTRNTYWEWYEHVDRFGDHIATVSKKGVKIWNSQLDVIDSYPLEDYNAYSLRSGGSNRFLVGLSDSSLAVIDRESRDVINNEALNYTNFKKNGRKPFFDRITNDVYVADDYYVKKFDVDGDLVASYRHEGDASYDVESTADNAFVFASNGQKVIKLKKSDLSLVSEIRTGSMGAAQGWAMGLKLVNTAFGDRLVVFNNSSILVMDSNLKLLAHAGKVSTEDNLTYPVENLYLLLSHNSATVGGEINLQGGGFWPNENLQINFEEISISLKADRFGRFNENIIIPEIEAGRYDFKVDGKSSNLTYSISFEVVE